MLNAKQRQQFAVKEGRGRDEEVKGMGDEIDSDIDQDLVDESDDEPDTINDDVNKGMQQDDDMSDGSESDLDSEDDDNRGHQGDRLQVSHALDIPEGLHIPVVSQLAKESAKRDAKSKA